MNTWLQVCKLEEGKSPAPIGEFAVMVDGAPEIVKTDSVEIYALSYDRQRGFLQVGLELGGYDSKGKWHEDPAYARIAKGVPWSRDQHADLWKLLDLDHFVARYMPATAEKIVDWFHQGDAVTSIGRDILRMPTLLASRVADETGKIVAPIKVALPVKVLPPVEIIKEK